MKKNNFKKAILLAFSTFALALGVGGAKKQADITAKAANIDTGQVLYLMPNENWVADNAYFAVWFFNGDAADDTFVDMSIGTSTKLYAVTTPTSNKGYYTNLIFTRQNPDNPTGWGDGVTWNQTSNLSFDGTNDVFILPEDSWNGAEDTDNWHPYNAATYSLAEIPASTDLYIRPSGTFMDGADRVSGYFFNSDGKNAWVDGTAEAGGLYKVVSPTLTDGVLPNKVIFVSMKPGTSGNSWDNKQDQTNDLIPDLTKPVFDHASDTWQGVPTVVTPIATTAGISSTRFRIWLDRNNHYPSEAHQYLLKVGTDRYSPTNFEKALDFGLDGIYFPYWDIEIATVKGKEVGFTIVNAANEVQVEVPASTFVEKDNSKLWRIQYDGDTATWSIQKDKVVGRVFASFVGKVLEGYLSCSANVDNGYGVFDLVNENFFEILEGGTWNVEGNLSDVTINDFEYVADYASGTKNATVDAYSKHQMLEANYIAMGGGGPAPFALMGSTTNTLLISMFAISLIGIGFVSFLALRKKREQNKNKA